MRKALVDWRGVGVGVGCVSVYKLMNVRTSRIEESHRNVFYFYTYITKVTPSLFKIIQFHYVSE